MRNSMSTKDKDKVNEQTSNAYRITFLVIYIYIYSFCPYSIFIYSPLRTIIRTYPNSATLASEEYEIAVSSAYIVALAFLRANGKSFT